jgi:hypothetical protein
MSDRESIWGIPIHPPEKESTPPHYRTCNMCCACVHWSFENKCTKYPDYYKDPNIIWAPYATCDDHNPGKLGSVRRL